MPIHTQSFANFTSAASTRPSPYCFAANTASRSRSWRAASCAALPFRSEPVDAAVADVFATLLVSVAVTRMRPKRIPSSCATTCATFVFSPCPISVPPWFTSTEPSV